MSIRGHHGLMLFYAWTPPVLEPTEHAVSSFLQSSVYAGLSVASVANMSDANGPGDAVTGTGTNASGIQFILADLGSPKPVSKIRFGGGNLAGWGNIFPTYILGPDFMVQHSNDTVVWTTANNTFVSGSNGAGDNRDVDIFVPPTVARYWRVTRAADIATATFRVFGYTTPIAPDLGITYSQSSVYTGANLGTAANLNESPFDPTTGAATNAAAGEWVKADLGEAKTVGAVVLGAGTSLVNWGGVATYLNGCTLEYSNDDVNWTVALTISNVTDNLPSIWPRELPLISARYWRVFRAAAGYVALTAFRLYTPPVTAPPIGTLYEEIMADMPWAYYQLNEAASPTPFADSSGNSRNLATIVPTVTAGGAGLFAPETSTDFNGTGYISSGNNEFGADIQAAFDGDKPITIVAVVNPDSLSTASSLLHVGNISVGESQGFFVSPRPDGAVRFQMLISGVAYKLIDSIPGALVPGQTAIIHVRRTAGGNGSIWVNGVNLTAGSTDLSGSIAAEQTVASGGTRIMLGALSAAAPSDFFDGKMQHVAIFDSALSDNRIQTQTLAALGTPTVGSHLYWGVRIDEVQGGTSTSCSIGEIQMRPYVGGPNLCKNGAASASSTFSGSYPASAAFDSNTTTRWASEASQPSRISYRFGIPVSIAEVMIRAPDVSNYASGQMPKNFSLQYSDDGVNWTTFGDPIINETTMAVDSERTWLFLEEAPAGQDKYLAYTRTLMQMSTDFSDTRGSEAWTVNGATISSGAALFDGVDDRLTRPANSDFTFGFNDFTVEGFYKSNSLTPTNQPLFDNRGSGTQGISAYAKRTPDHFSYINYASGYVTGTTATAFSTVDYDHWALCRQGDQVRGYINGVQVFVATDLTICPGNAGGFIGGSFISDTHQPLNGSMKGLRITRGQCRYRNGNTFTPPTSFPEIGPDYTETGPGKHRYWRVLITAASGGPGALYMGFTELVLWDRDLVAVSRNVGGTSSATASSSINGSNGALYAIDGSMNNGWLSSQATTPEWLRVDMQGANMVGAPVEVRSFDIYGSWNNPASSPKDFKLQWSDDNSVWTDAVSVTNQTGWLARERRSFKVF